MHFLMHIYPQALYSWCFSFWIMSKGSGLILLFSQATRSVGLWLGLQGCFVSDMLLISSFTTWHLRVLMFISYFVRSPSHVQLSVTLWTVAHQAFCPSPSPLVCTNSCSLHQQCHPAISSSDAFSFCPQSFPASGTFLVSRLSYSNSPSTTTIF